MDIWDSLFSLQIINEFLSMLKEKARGFREANLAPLRSPTVVRFGGVRWVNPWNKEDKPGKPERKGRVKVGGGQIDPPMFVGEGIARPVSYCI
jgi:hypothetical protein